jgi:chemotaxis protein methyltransferase CheR
MSFDRPSTELSFSDTEFRMFRELLRSHCGLHFADDLRYLLEKRVARRAQALGLASFASYHYLLRRGSDGDEEFARLIDDVTTNETYFMRERDQLRALIEEILPELLEAGSGPVNVWSAGCSSGEEPYSIVILALEAGLAPGRDLRVYASDISRSMLQKARQGDYRESSFRSTEDSLRRKYFVEREGLHRISDDVKRHVCFAHLNLLDPARQGLLGTMHVVLCRNVIIYFDLETKRRVVRAFDAKLRPGGYLLLGHSESLINLSTAFELRHLRHDMVYRKPGLGESLEAWNAGGARRRDLLSHEARS